MKEQIKKRISDYEKELDRLDTYIFYIDMIDRWDIKDKENWDNLHKKYKLIKEEIEILEEELKKYEN